MVQLELKRRPILTLHYAALYEKLFSCSTLLQEVKTDPPPPQTEDLPSYLTYACKTNQELEKNVLPDDYCQVCDR